MKYSLDALHAITPDQLRSRNGRLRVPTNPVRSKWRVLRATTRVSTGHRAVHPMNGQSSRTALWHLKRVGAAANCVVNVTFLTFRRAMIDVLNSTSFTDSDRRGESEMVEEPSLLRTDTCSQPQPAIMKRQGFRTRRIFLATHLSTLLVA